MIAPIETTLQAIGLTKGERKVYLALLTLGSTTTGPLIKSSGISGSKMYEVLDRLMKKGLVSTVLLNGVHRYEATSPERLLDYLEERVKSIQEEKLQVQRIVPALLLQSKQARSSTVKVFMGFEGLKTANEDILHSLNKGEEWLDMGLTEQPKIWEIYFNKKQHERAAKGIVYKLLLNEHYSSLYEQRKHLARTEIRFLPKSFAMPTAIQIYRNRTIIMILLQEQPLAILMESDAIAMSFRKYFSLLWRIAREPKKKISMK
ncbi:helix-turn-helix domain-containing protein [Candidatus Woesearchaeota archaeon]|nr:helix-turn-helix domain-containing protein [Candidatus Woesearchaeota archaeon]